MNDDTDRDPTYDYLWHGNAREAGINDPREFPDRLVEFVADNYPDDKELQVLVRGTAREVGIARELDRYVRKSRLASFLVKRARERGQRDAIEQARIGGRTWPINR